MPKLIEQVIEFEHFVDLAQNGRHPCASSGEKRARLLAECVAENVPGLDAEAMVGLVAYIQLASLAPLEACELIDLSPVP